MKPDYLINEYSCKTVRSASSRALNIVTIVLSLCALSACEGDDDNAATENTDAIASIDWTTCHERIDLECGTISLPLDYSKPEDTKIELSLIRWRSTGDARLGHLIMNPGGPGDSGIDLIRSLADGTNIPDALRQDFHLMSFDPRGVGQSGEPVCAQDIDLNEYPIGEGGLNELLGQYQAIQSTCFDQHGDFLQHLGSANVVRDMEEIRKANADDAMYFVGYSYGTRLGSLYLEMFPNTVAKLVLDAANPPQVNTADLLRDRIQEMKRIQLNWLDGCSALFADCDPIFIEQRLAQRLNDLIDQTDTSDPMTAQQAGQEAELLVALVFLVIEQPDIGFLLLEQIVNYANSYDFEELTALLAELQSLAGGNDVIAESDDDTVPIVFQSVLCADDALRPTRDDLLSLSNELNAVTDFFTETQLPLVAACSAWPEPLEPYPAFTQPSQGRTLIIGGTADYQTPLVWSQRLAESTGAPLITSDHSGHLIALTGNSACVDNTVIQFLTGSDTIVSHTCTAD
jgi:pimeloyl-ACP methyl ester carboxylesterase